MYIQEIILEGFKSYATRTVISGWDAEFNAITGLNGSGKSNILDAICFVLGIENLRQVRAATLQDLVYKRGQAGITKASVTIVFNNEDPDRSPVGFSEHKQITVTRQIVVGGKNKYLINGHNAPPKVVENLFQSVQLNINNPHFLIMQGQITKVLNMKPPEILAMLEETAGTRMFEDRKLKALQTMEKKEKKVEEIEALLKDTIEPKLDGLRKEKSEFVEFKRAEADIERLAKFLAAFDYHSSLLAREKKVAELTAVKEEQQALEEECRGNRAELETVNDKIMVINNKKEKESKASYKLKELEVSVKEAETELVKLQTQIEFTEEAITEQTKELDVLGERLKKDRSRLKEEESSVTKIQVQVDESEKAIAGLQERLAKDEELHRSLSTGISSKGGQSTGYEKLIEEGENRINDAIIKIQQSEMKSKSLAESLKSMSEDVAKARKESAGTAKKIDILKADISALETEKEGIQFDVNRERSLEEKKRGLESSLSALKESLERLRSSVSSIGFSYSDPYPGFNRAAVKGVVAELVQIPSENIKYANALEIAAGGKLWNVVVEDEKVANALLDKGRLTRRVTIIPLSKIVAKPIGGDKARLAHEATVGRAQTGLSLVTSADEVQEAIKFVFGGAFICEDKEAAVKVAFDSRIGAKAVTIEGDVYEPSGTLSGGSAPSSGSILARMGEYNLAQQECDQINLQFEGVRAELDAVRSARRKFADLEQRRDQKSHELKLLERQLSQNASGKLVLQHESMLSDITTLNAVIAENLEIKKAGEWELERLRSEFGQFQSNRGGKLKELEKQVERQKKDLVKEEKAFENLSAQFIKVKTEFELLGQSIQMLQAEIEEKEAEIAKGTEGLAGLKSAFFEHQSKTIGLKVKYDSELAHLRQFDEELAILDLERQQLTELIDKAQIDGKKLAGLVTALIDAVSLEDRRAASLMQQHSWIRDQQRNFGVVGGQFDFAATDMNSAKRQLAAAQEQHSRLKKTINFNVMDMIDRIEAKETALKQMLSTVKKDRKTIEETINKLNKYKLEALNKTYRKVNEDFGLIFGDLLPNSFATLQPLEGQAITDGLEIKVQLGGVWKSGLTELSGGQRSVIALSLILSLLQYKPAPMYILDEVDAALDLSHTENIGHLFQSRFKGSQFIVVSLKEGMFSNANVLFKTKFRDGISSVDRTENRTAASKPSAGKTTGKRTGIQVPKAKQAAATTVST